MGILTSISAFIATLGQVAQVANIVLQHNFEKDKELKDAKAQLLQEWQSVFVSGNKSDVLDTLQRLRNKG